ncbi:hypothetical protein B296_00048106 [Ensete ventricosum]|uniref:SWIB domain-containing protein n=1 Tax=Ensete ventricosum TaxID=4639 RepID=A0A426XRY6_ENSVE|nr:hypothetical protein B296_00048106 [Ensete ventricosum]
MARVLGGCRALMAAANAGAKVEAPAPKVAAKLKNAGIVKPLPVSPAMEKFVGASEISRTGVIKKIWEHIKLNQLQVLIPSCFGLPNLVLEIRCSMLITFVIQMQNPSNKREIQCDEKLKSIFEGRDKVGMLEIAKLVSAHFLKPN